MTTPIPIHHDDVLRAVTTIARTLINNGVAINFASTMALSLAKVIQADVELTIEEINKGIAESSIESPPGEPEGEGTSEEPEYGKAVAELPEKKPETTEQVSSGREDDEEPKSAERFNFTSLVKPTIEKQGHNAGMEQQAPTDDGLFTGLLRRISGDPAPQTDKLQVVRDKDHQIADLSEQASPQSKHDSTEAEKNITPEISPEGGQDETPTSALSESEATEEIDSAATDQVKSEAEGNEGAFDLTPLTQLDSVEKIHVDREVEQLEQELVKDAAINMDTLDLRIKLEKMVIELEKMVGVDCDSCGEKINSDQTFCPHCGKPKPVINLSSHKENPGIKDEFKPKKLRKRDRTSEPGRMGASQEPEYETIVPELPEQTPPSAEHDKMEGGENHEQSPTSLLTEEKKEQKPESTEQVSSEIEDDEEPKSTGRFDFPSLIKSDTEMQVDVADKEEQPGQEFAEEAAVNLAEPSAMNTATSEQQKKKNRDQICAVCNSPVRPGKKFCTHCGAIRCDNCKIFVKRDKECSNCHALL